MKKFRTYQLALSFYRDCQKCYVGDRIMRDQFKRASLSIVLNIAEGYGRVTSKDRRRFFTIAFGSLRETQCLLELLGEEELLKKADVVAASLYRLCQSPGCLLPIIRD